MQRGATTMRTSEDRSATLHELLIYFDVKFSERFSHESIKKRGAELCIIEIVSKSAYRQEAP